MEINMSLKFIILYFTTGTRLGFLNVGGREEVVGKRVAKGGEKLV